MRAFFNLLFFIIILAAGAFAGFLWGQAGQKVPGVSPFIEANFSGIFPGSGSGAEVQDLRDKLDAQARAIGSLNEAVQERNNALEVAAQSQNGLQNQIAGLQNALATAQAAAGNGQVSSPGAVDQAFVDDLIDQNQFLTETLTEYDIEVSELKQQLAAAQSAGTGDGGGGAADNGAIAALQQQLTAALQQQQNSDTALQAAQTRISELLTQNQSVQTALQQLGGERDQLIANLNNARGLIAQLQQQAQAAGVDLGQITSNPGVQNLLNSLTGN